VADGRVEGSGAGEGLKPRAVSGARPLRIAFVMEQVLGHVTVADNLRRAVTALGGVETRWVETTLFDPSGLPERMPGLPPFVRAGIRARLDLHRALRGWRYDVLVFNTQKAAALCQWDMLRTPTVLMTDVTPLQYDRLADLYRHTPDRNPALRTVKHLVNRWNFHLAAALIPYSTWARDSLVHDYGVPPERVHVIPPGVDTARWRPARHRRRSDRVRLLFVGGNFERKGGAVLLEVFRHLRLHERAELQVVTRDPVPPTPGVVVHHGLRNNSPELLALYQQADAFALPTLADCFSWASIEAMAAGLPVITTAVGGIPDIVEHGRTGYLLPPGDGRALGAALQRLIEDAALRAAMGRAGRARAVTRFDARANTARLLDLCSALRTNGGRTRRRPHVPADAMSPHLTCPLPPPGRTRHHGRT
jgi:glycosyltransferase involved in cell wall biosynthesis